MESNVINLGEYTMDEDDRALRELFRHPPLADDGFSERVVRRIRRRAFVVIAVFDLFSFWRFALLGLLQFLVLRV